MSARLVDIKKILAQLPDEEPDSDEMQDLILRIMRGVNGQAFRLFGNRVLTGPFAGMIIPQRNPFIDDGNSGVKLLGAYELELRPAIEHAIWRRPQLIVNVGCAEGYYAIGFARMMPHIQIIAYDIIAEVLTLCEEYAWQNECADRIELGLGCSTPEDMRVGFTGRRLYLMDCEAAEIELIDLERCPELITSDIIVECHDFLREGTSIELADRLSATHRVELVRPRLPDLNQFQFLKSYPTVMSALAVVEKRPMPCCWLACWANKRGA